jgi:chaperonin GroES
MSANKIKKIKLIYRRKIIVNLKPLSDRIILKVKEKEETTRSGIVLPESAKEKPQEAIVVAVGSGEVIDGKKVPLDVKAGDRVIYSKYSGMEVKLDGEEYLIVKQNDILAIITE